jgi:Ribbon-helix-helix protein, copG family
MVMNQIAADAMSAAKSKDERFSFRGTADVLEALDELRRAEKDVCSRGEMMRRLIMRARAAQLAQAKAKPKKEN